MYHCNTCQQDKPEQLFGKGRKTLCKVCANQYAKEYREKNKDIILIKQKQWYENYGREWKKHYDASRIESTNLRDRNRYHTDPSFRIKKILRTRFYKTIKSGKCSYSMLTYLGTSVEEFRKWIEYQIQGTHFTWENYGTMWDIDHVTPCSSFDLTLEEERFKCYNWSNMRPLSKHDNYVKSNKILKKHISNHMQVVATYKSLKSGTNVAQKWVTGME